MIAEKDQESLSLDIVMIVSSDAFKRILPKLYQIYLSIRREKFSCYESLS